MRAVKTRKIHNNTMQEMEQAADIDVGAAGVDSKYTILVLAANVRSEDPQLR